MNGIQVASSLLATIFGDIDRLDSKYLVEHGRITSLDQRDAEWWTSVVLACYPDTSHPAIGYEVESLLRSSDGDAMTLLTQVAVGVSRHPDSALAAARFPVSLFGRTADHTPEVFDGEPVTDSHLHSGGSMPLDVFLSGLATCPSPLGLETEPRRPALDSPDPLETERPRRERIAFVSGSGFEWDAMVLLAALRWSLRLLWFSERTGDLRNRSQLAAHALEADLVDLVLEGGFWKEVKKSAVSRGESGDLTDRLNSPFYDDGVCPSLRSLLSSWQRTPGLNTDRGRQLAVGLVRAIVAVSGLATSLPGEGLGRFSNRFRLMGKVQRAVFGTRSDGSISDWKRKFLVGTIAEIAPTPQVVAAEFRRTFKGSVKGDFKAEVLRELAIHNSAFADFCDEHHSMALTMPVGFARRGSVPPDPPGGLDELRHVVAGCNALTSIAQEEQGGELIRAIWSIDVAGSEIGSSNWPFQIGAQLLREAGVELLFTIHAGESFTSELNGIRRVGELFLGDVQPERIGHALSLSKDTAQAVLSRGRPPISRVEAIMDLAWLSLATGSQEAMTTLEELTPRSLPRRSIGAETWIEAFDALHQLGKVDDLLIATSGGQREVPRLVTLGEELKPSSAALELAIGALAAGIPAEVVGCDVMSELDEDELCSYEEVVARESGAAREHVLDLVANNGVTIESCPSSNVTLAGLPGYAAHPLWEWSSASRPVDVSVSSDDPLHFGNNVLQELNAMLATGKDESSVRDAIDVGIRECSGGNKKRLDGRRGYLKIVDLIGGSSLPG